MPRPYLQVMMAITAVIAASYFLMPGLEHDEEVSEWQQALAKTYLINTRTATYDEEGKLTDVLQAATATFYPSKKESTLEEPRLYSHNLNDDTWSVSAEAGRYDHRREILTLSTAVVLSNDSQNVQLTTEQMRIDLKKNLASTKVPVTIIQGTNTTRADGMVANLDAQTVRLQPNVESTYVKP